MARLVAWGHGGMGAWGHAFAGCALSLAMVFSGADAYEGKNCDSGGDVLQDEGCRPPMLL
jgi:hypothetical protein